MKELMKALQEPFAPEDIEWRIQRAGKTNDKCWAMVLAYVTNRAIMARLDDVFGIDGWKNEYKEWHGNGQLCGISIWDDQKRQWITKWDGADNTNIEATKGGLSDSMKRTAVQWGIGRYLYNLEATFAVVTKEKARYKANCKAKVNGKDEWLNFNWDPPVLPKWALPSKKLTEKEQKIAEAQRDAQKTVVLEKPTGAPSATEADQAAQMSLRMDVFINLLLIKGIEVGPIPATWLEKKQLVMGLFEPLSADEKRAIAKLCVELSKTGKEEGKRLPTELTGAQLAHALTKTQQELRKLKEKEL